VEELNDNEFETGDLRVDMAEAMDDLQEGVERVNEIHEANNAAPKTSDKEKVTSKFDFDEDTLMGEAGASTAEGEGATEGEQAQGAEDDGDSNMDDWNEDEHAPNIWKEVEAAWKKLSKSSKNKNTKSDWIRKNVEARKLVSTEEHHKSRSREKAVARATKHKQERAQKKRAEVHNEQKGSKEPTAETTTDTVRKTQVWLLEFEIARVRKYAEECMKNMAAVIKGIEGASTSEYGKKAQGDESDVTIVKLHAKMCQGPMEIEALAAGGKLLACVGETEDGESEELTEWQEHEGKSYCRPTMS
jgi:hypothetical protein